MHTCPTGKASLYSMYIYLIYIRMFLYSVPRLGLTIGASWRHSLDHTV